MRNEKNPKTHRDSLPNTSNMPPAVVQMSFHDLKSIYVAEVSAATKDGTEIQ